MIRLVARSDAVSTIGTERSTRMQSVAIYGAGGFAREAAWLVEACDGSRGAYRVECFVDDEADRHGQHLNEIPVMGLQEAYSRFPDAMLIGAVGSPSLSERLMQNAAMEGLAFGTLVHTRVEISRWVDIGEGTLICAGNILTTNIVLGKHVHINLDCTIGHDVVMGDYTTLAPGVHVSGCVRIGKRVYIGTGATLLNGTRDQPLVIADDVVIGAGACVTKRVDRGITVVGVPARPVGP
jgi:sugar O-acyltransferase (sialic acid O-acetyltransferase NeuD family)